MPAVEQSLHALAGISLAQRLAQALERPTEKQDYGATRTLRLPLPAR